jgi:site-specific recombinase XerD
MRPSFFEGVTLYLKASGRTLASSGALFLPEDPGARGRGTGMATDGVQQRATRLLHRAGVEGPRMSVHALRHMYAISILRQSGNVMVVQKLLGHSSVSTTMRYLDHLELRDLRTNLPEAPRLSASAQAARAARAVERAYISS